MHRLVTAALLLFSAATALSPAFTHQPPGVPSAVSLRPGKPGAAGRPRRPPSRGQAPGGAGSGRAGRTGRAGGRRGGPAAPASGQGQALEPAHHRVRRTEKIYVVQPPEGRYHESLWEIAQNHLGDGERYREIFELNAGRVQPDGSSSPSRSLIRPGWVLRMPRDAHGPGIRVVTLHGHTGSGDASSATQRDDGRTAPAGPALAWVSASRVSAGRASAARHGQ
mgnify:CR=1 FL=1